MDSLIDARYAAMRLLIALALMTVGTSGMYVVAVALPAVQADFGVTRADASLTYTLTLIGFGGLLMGRLADQRGVHEAAYSVANGSFAPVCAT